MLLKSDAAQNQLKVPRYAWAMIFVLAMLLWVCGDMIERLYILQEKEGRNEIYLQLVR